MDSIYVVFTYPNFLWVIEKFGFISVAVTVFVYWFDQRRLRIRQEKEERGKMRRACSALLTEIEHNEFITNTDENSKQEQYYTVIDRNEDIHYGAAKFSSGAYVSLLNSGFYTSFSAETQKNLLALYERINEYNNFQLYLNHYLDKHTIANKEDLFVQNAKRYEIVMSKYMSEIIELMNATKAQLNQKISSL